jgi:hypothetical protein
MSGLGKPPAGYDDLGVTARRVESAASSEWEKPFGYELQHSRTVSNVNNLTNETDPSHLQNCISEPGYLFDLLDFIAYLPEQIGKKGGARTRQITISGRFYHSMTTAYPYYGGWTAAIEVQID